MRTFLRSLVLGILPFSAVADVFVVDFAGTVRMNLGAPVPSVPVGSTVTGHLEVDLATLPPESAHSGVLGVYSYLSRAPGFTFALSLGDQTIHYDSVRASQEGGPGPGIWMQHGTGFSDGLTFTLREQGNPYTLGLAVFDHSQPMQLVGGARFPQDVHISGSTVDVGEITYSKVGSNDMVDALITRLTVTVIPEPTVVSLFTMGVGILGLRSRVGSRAKTWRGAR